MSEAEGKVAESAGFEFIWDWPDGEALTTMPSQDFWLFGQLEPYTYELQVVSTFSDGKDSIIDTEKVWYKSNGTIVAPTYGLTPSFLATSTVLSLLPSLTMHTSKFG